MNKSLIVCNSILFHGSILICIKQEPSRSRVETPSDVLPRKRLQELLGPEISVSCEYNGVIIA